jgi:hypothetical protein
MIGITLTTDQIRNAPAQVRQWIEHEVIASLGLAADAPAAMEHPQAAHLVACTTEDAAAVLAQVQGMVPAFNVFFEFARPGISFGQPPAMAFRLIDILYHTRLQDIGRSSNASRRSTKRWRTCATMPRPNFATSTIRATA